MNLFYFSKLMLMIHDPSSHESHQLFKHEPGFPHRLTYTDSSLAFLPIMAGRVAGSIWAGLLATTPRWIGEKYSQTMPLILLVTTVHGSVLLLLTKCLITSYSLFIFLSLWPFSRSLR